jgi:ATP synthase protein I
MKSRNWLLPQIGSWSFIVGVIIAIISGFFEYSSSIISVLVLLGVIVGFLNISGSEAMTFLVAAVSMVVISSLGAPAFNNIYIIGAPLQQMLNNMIVFIMPASVIVALRAILTLAYKK